MNPDSLHQPSSFDLPPPQPEGRPQPGPEQAGAEKQQAEKRSQAPELPAAAFPAAMAGMPPAVPAASPQTPPPAATTDDGLAADDADLIEKAWVERAKAIVAGTRDDPYRQNKELNNFKADYMKKRYNKEIKVE